MRQIPPADNGRGSDELQNQPREDRTPLIGASRRRQDGVNLLSGNAKEAMSEDGPGDSRSNADLELTRGRGVGALPAVEGPSSPGGQYHLCSGTTAEKPLSGSTRTREEERDGGPPTRGFNDEPVTSTARCTTGRGELIGDQTAEGQSRDGATAPEDGLPATGDGRLGSSSRKRPSIDVKVDRGGSYA